MKSSSNKKVTYKLDCAIVICRILYKSTFEEIEQKTGVKKDIAGKFIKCIIKLVGCEDFYEILAYIGDLEWFEEYFELQIVQSYPQIFKI